MPSAFTVPTGQAHWHTLLHARAVENLAWVIAPAQVGTYSGKLKTFGHSLIIDPWGDILAEHMGVPGVILAEFDRDRARIKRRQFPVLEHKVLK